MMSLENQQQCEIWNPSAFLSSFSHWHVKQFVSKCIVLKVDLFSDQKYAVCRRIHASFSPEILQAVKGLNSWTMTYQPRFIFQLVKHGGDSGQEVFFLISLCAIVSALGCHLRTDLQVKNPIRSQQASFRLFTPVEADTLATKQQNTVKLDNQQGQKFPESFHGS